jgi:tellurite methyltransferase
MVTPGSARDWSEYLRLARHRPPRPLLVEALPFVEHRDAAIDLGSGALNDSRLLVREGFRQVIALDHAPIAQSIADTLRADRFSYVISAFEDYDFPAAAFDLVNAQFALPFIRPRAFSAVFGAILGSRKPGGILAGQLFGDRDEWKNDPNMSFHTEAEARALLMELEVLTFREMDGDAETTMGEMKHWHIFHIIARKPPA